VIVRVDQWEARALDPMLGNSLHRLGLEFM
jgi:hypothetical protein